MFCLEFSILGFENFMEIRKQLFFVILKKITKENLTTHQETKKGLFS